MPPRKKRIRVVLDTNVIIGFHLSTNPDSANSLTYRLWRNHRKLQLIVSQETVSEYLEILHKLGVAEQQIRLLEARLEKRETVTHVNLGPRPTASRDPDDNIILATAIAGKAQFLVTNDRDLLDISAEDKRKLPFRIVTPIEMLRQIS